MRPAVRGWVPGFVGLILVAGASAQVNPTFNLPSKLTPTTVNGVQKDGPIVTSQTTVSVGFQTDAVASATWIVYPIGATGSSGVFPPADSVGVHIPPANFGSPFQIRLGMKAVAPAVATTLPAFTGAESVSVIVDLEEPEVTVTEIQIGDRVIRLGQGEEVFVNGDFTVRGQVTDNVSKGEDISVRFRFGSNTGSPVQADPGGRFEIQVPVAGLADGDYDLEILAEDKTDDESRANLRVFRLDL